MSSPETVIIGPIQPSGPTAPSLPRKHIADLAKEIASTYGLLRVSIDVDFAVGRADVKIQDTAGNTLVIGASHDGVSIMATTPTKVIHEYIPSPASTGLGALLGLVVATAIVYAMLTGILQATPTDTRITSLLGVNTMEEAVALLKTMITS